MPLEKVRQGGVVRIVLRDTAATTEQSTRAGKEDGRPAPATASPTASPKLGKKGSGRGAGEHVFSVHVGAAAKNHVAGESWRGTL